MRQKTTAMITSNCGWYVDAARNAGIPSIIGDDPKIKSKAVRPVAA